MGHAANFSSKVRLHRNDEPVVAYSHDLVLDRIARAAHNRFERFRQTRPLVVYLASQTPQFGGGGVIYLSAWKKSLVDALDSREQRRRDRFDNTPERRHRLFLRLDRRTRKD